MTAGLEAQKIGLTVCGCAKDCLAQFEKQEIELTRLNIQEMEKSEADGTPWVTKA